VAYQLGGFGFYHLADVHQIFLSIQKSVKQITNTRDTPPGGWRYKEPSTGVSFDDLNYNAIITAIRKHREAMNLPVTGNWIDDVQDLMVQMNPQIPHKEIGVPERRVTADDVFAFVTVVREMLKGRELVSEEEQLRRASICAVCPKNGTVNCKWCGWLAGQITEMMGGRSIPKVESIFKRSCMACGCDLTAKTAIPMDILTQVDSQKGEQPDYWTGCWMREE
jgi:hypothetical protein